jgi:hypothetical protein
MQRSLLRLQKYATGLESGLLSMPEVVAGILDELAESPDRAALWAATPTALRRSVLAFLAGVGLDGRVRE